MTATVDTEIAVLARDVFSKKFRITVKPVSTSALTTMLSGHPDRRPSQSIDEAITILRSPNVLGSNNRFSKLPVALQTRLMRTATLRVRPAYYNFRSENRNFGRARWFGTVHLFPFSLVLSRRSYRCGISIRPQVFNVC